MLRLSKLTALLLVLTLTPVLPAQIVIKPAVPKAGEYTVETTLEIQQTLKITGMELQTGQKRKAVTKNIASKPAANGDVTVVETFESLTDETTLPGGVALKFDSAVGPKPQGTAADFLVDVMAAIAKSKTTLVFDKEGNVKSALATVDGIEELEEPGKSLLQADFDPQGLKDKSNSQIQEYNAKPVTPGAVWKKDTSTDLGQGAKFTHTATSKYVGVEEVKSRKLHKVTITYTDVNFTQDAPAPGAPSVTGSDLELVDGGTTYFFDAEKNQIVDSVFKLHVKGAITLSVQGMEIPAELDISMTQAVKIK